MARSQGARSSGSESPGPAAGGAGTPGRPRAPVTHAQPWSTGSLHASRPPAAKTSPAAPTRDSPVQRPPLPRPASPRPGPPPGRPEGAPRREDRERAGSDNRQTAAFVAGAGRPYPADGGSAAARGGGPGAEDRGGLALLVAGEVRGPLAVGAGGERRPVARREVLQVELHVHVFALLPRRERHIVGHQLTLQLLLRQDRGVFQELRHLGGESPSPQPSHPRSRRCACSLPEGGALPPPSRTASAGEPRAGQTKTKTKLAHGKRSRSRTQKPPEPNCGQSAAQSGARTNPSPHTTAKERSLLRPRPKNARRHWPAAGGSAAAIGPAPRAGSISRGSCERWWKRSLKAARAGAAAPGPFLFPFSPPFPSVDADKEPVGLLLCTVSCPRCEGRSPRPRVGRRPRRGPRPGLSQRRTPTAEE